MTSSAFLSMRRRIALAINAVLFVSFTAGAHDSEGAGHQGHTMVAPASIKWNPVGPAMSMAVLSGSPETEGSSFVIRIRLADGAKIPPHWHPVDEHVTVVSGAFYMGAGETVDESAATAMTAGSYSLMPRGVRHFVWARGETIVQIHGTGPFRTFFVEQPKK